MRIDAACQLAAHMSDTKVLGKKMRVAGLPVTVEHAKHTNRVLHDNKGNVVYKVLMHHDYGYISGTKGRDGDEVDCFVGPIKDPKEVYVIHMKDMGPVVGEREDEDKVMLGFQSADAAKAAFLMHYPATFFESMTTLPIKLFRKKLKAASKPYTNTKIHAKGKQKCPFCGSSNIGLMPTDFETKRCSNCKRIVGLLNQAKIHAVNQAKCCVGCGSYNLDMKAGKCRECGKTFPQMTAKLKKSKSKAAFEYNVKKSMKEGKPQKQAVAIAYDIRRRAK